MAWTDERSDMNPNDRSFVDRNDRLAPAISDRRERAHRAAQAITPRCLDREQAAVYLGSSVDVVDRGIQSGAIPIVKLPIARHHATGRGVAGVSRRILIDVRDLDSLIERSKERLNKPE